MNRIESQLEGKIILEWQVQTIISPFDLPSLFQLGYFHHVLTSVQISRVFPHFGFLSKSLPALKTKQLEPKYQLPACHPFYLRLQQSRSIDFQKAKRVAWEIFQPVCDLKYSSSDLAERFPPS